MSICSCFHGNFITLPKKAGILCSSFIVHTHMVSICSPFSRVVLSWNHYCGLV